MSSLPSTEEPAPSTADTRPVRAARPPVPWIAVLNAALIVTLAGTFVVNVGGAVRARQARGKAQEVLAALEKRQELHYRSHGGRFATRLEQIGAGQTEQGRVQADGSLQVGVFNFVLTNPGGEGAYRIVATANLDRDPWYEVLEVAAVPAGAAASGDPSSPPGARFRVVSTDRWDRRGDPPGPLPGAGPGPRDQAGP